MLRQKTIIKYCLISIKKIIEKNNFLNDFVIINIVDIHKKFDEILLKKFIFLFVFFNFDLNRNYKIKIFENAFDLLKKIINNNELIVEN